MPKKRFVTWSAVSSLPQARKISPEDQKRLAREHVARHDGEIVQELEVAGKSRSIVLFEDACKRIPAYAELRDLIMRKAFDIFIFLDRSRLGRKASLSMAVVELCHEAGIITYEIESPPATLDSVHESHDDQLIGAIKSVGAQREIQKIQERHRMGMIGRVQEGKLPSGAAPFGYRIEYDLSGNASVKIDEAAAIVVRKIFEMYLAGRGAPAIADHLNGIGSHSPTGRRWENVLIKSIIRRVWRYAGYGEINAYRNMGEKRATQQKRPYFKSKGTWEPIVSEEVALRVVEERKARSERRRLSDTPYLLSGIVWCQVCQRRMRINSTQRQRPSARRQIWFICPGAHPHRQISYYRVLDAVRFDLNEIGQRVSIEDLIGDESSVDYTGQIERCNDAIAQLDAQTRRADDMYVSGVMSAERYKRQIERIAEQVATHKNEIQRLHELTANETQRGRRRDRLEEIRTAGVRKLDSDDVTAANAWLRAHLRVAVENHKVIEIEYL